MRDAAYEIAAQRDDFAPSLLSRFCSAIARPFQLLSTHFWGDDIDLLDKLDDRLLGDIGLSRNDHELRHAGLQTVAQISERRGYDRALQDRWTPRGARGQ